MDEDINHLDIPLRYAVADDVPPRSWWSPYLAARPDNNILYKRTEAAASSGLARLRREVDHVGARALEFALLDGNETLEEFGEGTCEKEEGCEHDCEEEEETGNSTGIGEGLGEDEESWTGVGGSTIVPEL